LAVQKVDPGAAPPAVPVPVPVPVPVVGAAVPPVPDEVDGATVPVPVVPDVVPLVPDDVEGVTAAPPVVPDVVPLEVVPEVPDAVVPDDVVPVAVVSVVVVSVEVSDVAEDAESLSGASGGAFRGWSCAVGFVLPQAATPSAAKSPRAVTRTGRRARRMRSAAERGHPPPTRGAVIEVLLGELVTPVAEAQVLDRPGELGRGGGEGQQLGDDLELLAGLAITVDAPGLGLDDHLAAGRGRAHAVLLPQSHCARG
jgi:hypothetical protein